MSVIEPRQWPSDQVAYITEHSGSTSFGGPWLDVGLYHEVGFSMNWLGVNHMTGTLSVVGTNDPNYAASGAEAVPLTGSISHGSWPTITDSPGNAMIAFENPPHWIRLVCVVTAPTGSGDIKFTTHVHARAT
jgi:hypothetical protein